jgi:hypothetical protein
MSDFDDVLERLLVDTEFRALLAAQPDAALSGYQLSDEEREILLAQLSADQGGPHQVEQRISKASMAGLLDADAFGRKAGGDPQGYLFGKIDKGSPDPY